MVKGGEGSGGGPWRPLGTRYLVGERIGRGAFGQVHRGRVKATGAAVAIKILRGELVDQPDVVTRFAQERQLLQTLDHPNIVTVHELIVDGDDLAIVMDLVEAGDLAHAVPHPCPPELAVDVTAQIADALVAVHAAGIVHRDLKPSNILCQRDGAGRLTARLTDFGIARLVGSAATRVTSYVGTAGFTAPEVFAGQPVTGAADVYALGVVHYELLTGRAPFVADNAQALMHAHSFASVPRPDNLPDPDWALLSAMLAKDPAARPSPADVARQLRGRSMQIAAAGPFSVTDSPTSPAAQPTPDDATAALTVRTPRPDVTGDGTPRRPRARRLALIATAAGISVALVVGLTYAVTRWASRTADGGTIAASSAPVVVGRDGSSSGATSSPPTSAPTTGLTPSPSVVAVTSPTTPEPPSAPVARTRTVIKSTTTTTVVVRPPSAAGRTCTLENARSGPFEGGASFTVAYELCSDGTSRVNQFAYSSGPKPLAVTPVVKVMGGPIFWQSQYVDASGVERKECPCRIPSGQAKVWSIGGKYVPVRYQAYMAYRDWATQASYVYTVTIPLG